MLAGLHQIPSDVRLAEPHARPLQEGVRGHLAEVPISIFLFILCSKSISGAISYFFLLKKYFWSAPNRSGEQGTVTEGEMVGCIIGLSTLSATKPLEIFKYSEYFGV